MTTHKDDVELLEKELAARLGAPLDELRARRVHCPPLEMLRAVAGDALSAELRVEVEQHLSACALCRAMAADLQNDALVAPSPAEAQRIRARVHAGGGVEAPAKSPKSNAAMGFWSLFARPAFALAVLALLFVWLGRVAVQGPGTPPVAQQPQATPPIPAALRLEMPDVRLPASTVLLMRGGEDAQQYLKELAPALDAYRAGNYAGAAKEFAALEPKHPRAVELFFYGGVSRLFLEQSGVAVRSLERAQALKEPEFTDEVSWYLGLAYHRAGNSGAARGQFEKLCAGKGPFSARACDAARALDGSVAPPGPR